MEIQFSEIKERKELILNEDDLDFGKVFADYMLDETACAAPALGCAMRELCMGGCPLMLQVVLCESDERDRLVFGGQLLLRRYSEESIQRHSFELGRACGSRRMDLAGRE